MLNAVKKGMPIESNNVLKTISLTILLHHFYNILYNIIEISDYL
jgi:hypothetical protein